MGRRVRSRWLERHLLGYCCLALAVSGCQLVCGVESRTLSTVGCEPLPDNPSEVWVAAAADAGGTGTEACPFSTITEGLEAIEASESDERTLHVGPGYYDQSLGETFPLTIRGPLTFAGAGADQTLIDGQGDGHLPEGVNGSAGIVVHSELGRVTLRDITFGDPERPSGANGIVCVNGNATLDVAPMPPMVDPNFIVQDVTILNQAAGLVITGDVDRACALELVRSTLSQNGWAVWSIGRDGHCPSVEIGGPDPSDGNRFIGNRLGETAAGVNLWDCSSVMLVDNNTFEDNAFGTIIPWHWLVGDAEPVPYVRVSGNTFTGNDVGVGLGGPNYINELDDNVFEGNDLALHIEGDPTYPTKSANVISARRNRITRNGTGIRFDARPDQFDQIMPIGDNARSDFGRTSSPGLNLISCNDIDVIVAQPSSKGIYMSGNYWDHVPPSVETLAATVNGDILRSIETAASVIVTGAELADDACD